MIESAALYALKSFYGRGCSSLGKPRAPPPPYRIIPVLLLSLCSPRSIMEPIAWRLHIFCVSSVCVPGAALAAASSSVAAVWRAGAYLPAGLHIFGVGECVALYIATVSCTCCSMVWYVVGYVVRGLTVIMRLFLMALKYGILWENPVNRQPTLPTLRAQCIVRYERGAGPAWGRGGARGRSKPCTTVSRVALGLTIIHRFGSSE